ncbi:MAG: hypothetical protein QOF48_826 [Verrucomicrobiota bacterium]
MLRSAGLTPKSVLITFVVVGVLYFAAFWGIERFRQHRGPWEITFSDNAQGEAVLSVSQRALKISGVQLIVHGEHATNAPGSVRFDRVLMPVPFGRVIYEDLTFLPGVVTFDLFGHEVELLPRVLIVNKKEVPWQSGIVVDLWPTNKPAEPPQPPKQR